MAKGKFEKPRSTAAKTAVKYGKKSKKSKNAGSGGATAAILITLALVLGLGCYAFGARLLGGDTVFPNVRVFGHDVGGMTEAEAKAVIDQAVEEAKAASTLQVTLSDGYTLTFDPDQANVAVDGQAALDAAMAFGRENGAFSALLTWFKSQKAPQEADLHQAMDLNTGYIRSLIDDAAAQTLLAPQATQVSHNKEANRLDVQVGQHGRALDADALYEAVTRAMYEGDFSPIAWEYDQVPYEILDLGKYYETLSKAPQDAYYDAENHKIVESVSGYGFDLDAANARIASAQPGSVLTIDLEEQLPKVPTELLTSQMFGTKLESRSSPYNAAQVGRTENLRLACLALNGAIINPGEVFSFNNIVGERTAEKGYQPATIYDGQGASSDGLGGGVCQVASTIYYTTLHMEVQQVMREPHMYRVYYVPIGMDAAIYYDSGLDYKFKNTLSNPIKLQANIDGGNVNITFWGVKENDHYVEMTSAELESIPYEVEEKLDETKPIGYRQQSQYPYTGYKAEAYRTVYDGQGNVLNKSTTYSYYKPRNEIIIVGPTEEAPPPEEEWPDWDEDWEDGWDNGWEDEEDYWP